MRTFAPGDKVMQIEIDYEKEVHNGDIGYIDDVDIDSGELTASFDGRTSTYGSPAAEALAGKYPLAATLVLRAMIDFSLKNGRSTRYQHAARRLDDCAGLSSAIDDFGRFEPHDAYVTRLHREHARKSSFWTASADPWRAA